MNSSRDELPAKASLYRALVRHNSATNGETKISKLNCGFGLSLGNLERDALGEENPGLVRGMIQPGAGVETEAGPE
jgi:hypothetical protein